MEAALTPSQESECLPCALIGVLLGALAVVVLVKLMVLAPPKAITLPLDATCSLSSATCAATLPDGGRLEFTLGPQPVPLLKPLSIALRIEGSSARALEVDFNGVNLPMAFNRADLTPAGNGQYAGQAILPLCANGRMAWQATVLVEDGQRRIYVPFRFETERGNSVGWSEERTPAPVRMERSAGVRGLTPAYAPLPY
ncbi:MAG: hypothetical protein KGZ83_00305 [Sulfuricella sp.]|nr:hypothetical protein [Sulfuricella sp.]